MLDILSDAEDIYSAGPPPASFPGWLSRLSPLPPSVSAADGAALCHPVCISPAASNLLFNLRRLNPLHMPGPSYNRFIHAFPSAGDTSTRTQRTKTKYASPSMYLDLYIHSTIARHSNLLNHLRCALQARFRYKFAVHRQASRGGDLAVVIIT